MAADLQVAAYVRMIERYASGDLLDLGCGSVPLYGAYREKVRTVTCADWPDSMHENRHVDMEIDLTQTIPLSECVFDTVVMTDVLEHLPDPDLAISEVARILRPDGHALIGVPFMYGIHEAPFDYHRYTEYRLRHLCKSHALTVVDLASYGDGLHSLMDQLIKQFGRRAGAGSLIGAASVAGAHRRPRAGSHAPLGYTLVARSG